MQPAWLGLAVLHYGLHHLCEMNSLGAVGSAPSGLPVCERSWLQKISTCSGLSCLEASTTQGCSLGPGSWATSASAVQCSVSVETAPQGLCGFRCASGFPASCLMVQAFSIKDAVTAFRRRVCLWAISWPFQWCPVHFALARGRRCFGQWDRGCSSRGRGRFGYT